jgi:hypothetical protein
MFNAEGLDTLKLTPHEREAITLILNSQSPRPERRRAGRTCRFQNHAGLILRVQHPGGTIVPYRVTPRELSELGMGFLHGNFLYPGSTCRFDLRRRDGESVAVMARIVRCDHITGRVHDIGIEFAEPVDVAQFPDVVCDEGPAVKDPVETKARPAYWIKK